MNEDTEDARVYAVRLSRQADQDAEEATLYLDNATSDKTLAKEWLVGLYLEIGRLATSPRRHVVLEGETRLFGRETRRVIYRRSPSSVAYLVFFSVAEVSEDGPTVTILHIRHGSRKPLTRAEALEILAGQ